MKLWFKSKSYGWGWTPASKEGWIATIVFIAAVIYVATEYAENNTPMFLGSLLALVAVFILIAYYTGEKPHWSWGKKK